MKLTQIFLIVFSFLFSIFTNAQNYSVDKGQEFTPPDAGKWDKFAGENATNFFMLRVSKKGRGISYFIESFNKANREKKYELEVPIEEESKLTVDPKHLQIFCANDNIFLCFYGRKNPDLPLSYFIKTVYSDGRLGALNEILNTNEKVDVDFYQSPDKTKLLTIASWPWVDGKQNVEATMFEAATLRKLWNKRLPTDFKNGSMESYYYNVDNTGNVYFLMQYVINKEERQIGMGMGILGIANEKAKMVPLISKNPGQIENGRAMIAANGKFIFTGLYKSELQKDESAMASMSRKEKAEYEKQRTFNKEVGFFSFMVDNNTMEVTSDFKKFPEEVSKKLDYAGGLLTSGAGNKYYKASQLVEANGDFYIIENHSYTITGDAVATYEREFIVSKVNKQGSIAWTKVYPKNTINNLNTFNVLVHDNNVHLFYLEHPDNLENSTIDSYLPEKYKDIKNYNGSVVVALEISSDGSAKRTKIFDNKGWCYDPQPFNITLKKDNSLLLRMINKGDERFDVINIQ
ncbi:MAG: hypothetical protein K0Q95_2320 [Bacteroidota bacterium]|jgi:hypothetical protein|nr:hypothetical protein [Bacteroidota bacterium]